MPSLDVVEESDAGISMASRGNMADQRAIERGVAVRRYGIVVAGANAAHRNADAEGERGVLGTVFRVMDHTACLGPKLKHGTRGSGRPPPWVVAQRIVSTAQSFPPSGLIAIGRLGSLQPQAHRQSARALSLVSLISTSEANGAHGNGWNFTPFAPVG